MIWRHFFIHFIRLSFFNFFYNFNRLKCKVNCFLTKPGDVSIKFCTWYRITSKKAFKDIIWLNNIIRWYECMLLLFFQILHLWAYCSVFFISFISELRPMSKQISYFFILHDPLCEINNIHTHNSSSLSNTSTSLTIVRHRIKIFITHHHAFILYWHNCLIRMFLSHFNFIHKFRFSPVLGTCVCIVFEQCWFIDVLLNALLKFTFKYNVDFFTFLPLFVHCFVFIKAFFFEVKQY